MSVDRDLPHLAAPLRHLPDTGRIEAVAGVIAIALLVILAAANVVAQTVIYVIGSIA